MATGAPTITDRAELRAMRPSRVMRFALMAAAKSGTTWMQRLLSAHPQIHCAESRAFGTYFDPKNPTAIHITIDSFVQNLQRYYHPPADAGPDFAERMLFNIVDAIGKTTLEHCRKPIYGEKITPYWGTGSQIVDRLHAYNPDLRFIHLVRDPRDVVVSGFVHQANIRIGSGHARAAHYRACLDAQRIDDEILESSLALWTDSNSAAMLATERFEQAMLLRYEDLLTDGPTHVGRLLAFIGAAHDADTTIACIEAASFQALSGGRTEGQEDRSSFFRKGIAGDWKNWFTPEQLDRLVRLAGETMASLGYDPGERV